MLTLEIEHDKENRSLSLTARNMNELIEKIKEWRLWENNLDAFELTKEFKKNSNSFLKKERDSGFYYFN